MATPAGALSRTDLGSGNTDNVREDLSDIIYNIDPTETPIHANVGKADAQSDRHEWLIDNLANAVNNNAHVDGDDFTAEGEAQTGDGFDGVTINGADRLGNWQVISRKDIVTTRRADIVRKAGRRSELNYQIAKAGRELKRDCEMAVTSINFGTQTTETSAGRTAGMPTWLTTSTETASADVEGTPTGHNDGVLTNGTPAAPASGFDADNVGAMTETLLLSTIASMYNAGGDPDMIMLHPNAKQQMSRFMFTAGQAGGARIATQYQDAGPNKKNGLTVVGAVDVYVSDFGVLDITPNRFQRDRDIFVLESEMWAVSYLDGYHIEKIGKTGDSEKRVMLVDFGLVSKNEAASGAIFDVDATAAWTA